MTLLAVSVLGAGTVAHAEIVTIDYSGIVDYANVGSLIAGSDADYLGRTVSGQIVVDTNKIRGARLYAGDGPDAIGIKGSDPTWLTGTVSVASAGLSATIDYSPATNTEITYFPSPSSLTGLGIPWYMLSTYTGPRKPSETLSLELGTACGLTVSGFTAQVTPGTNCGIGWFTRYDGVANFNNINFAIQSLTSAVSDAAGPGYTDPASVPITSYWYTSVGGGDINLVNAVLLPPIVMADPVATVDEPSSGPVLMLGWAAIMFWSQIRRSRL